MDYPEVAREKRALEDVEKLTKQLSDMLKEKEVEKEVEKEEAEQTL